MAVKMFCLLLSTTAGEVGEYETMRQAAITLNKPLVVFVNCSVRPIPGAICVRCDHFPGISRGIVPTAPNGGELWLLRAIGAEATDQQIVAELSRLMAAVLRPAEEAKAQLPFRGQGKPSADADQNRLVSLWPVGVDMPSGMRAFRPTRFTQRIAITNGSFSNAWYGLSQDDVWTNSAPSLNPNSRFPWAVPGGLHQSTGWEALRGVWMPGKAQLWSERVNVPNSAPLPKVRWSYPEGTIFADLLAKDGVCFELRLREKIDGRWQSFVAHKNVNARPEGFHGAGKSCASCHEQAGSSLQYGITLRGDDECFSFNPMVEHATE